MSRANLIFMMSIALLAGASMMLMMSSQGVEAYPIKYYRVYGTYTQNLADAMRVLRKHMHPGTDNERRCNLITSVLHKRSLKALTQFEIWYAAKLSNQELAKELINLPKDNVVEYYTNVIDEYMQAGNMDSSIIDVVSCAQGLFYTTNLKIRQLSKDQNLAKSMSQWSSITELSTSFLNSQDFKHPNLSYEELTEPVRSSLLKLFKGNEDLLKSKFLSNEEELDQTAEAEQLLAKTKALVDKFYADILVDDDKWTDESLCHVYGNLIKAARGDISEEAAIKDASDIGIIIDTEGHAPEGLDLNDEDVLILIDVTKTSIELQPEDSLWQDLTDCVATKQELPAVSAFMNSRLLKDRIEAAELAAAAIAA